MAFIWLHLITAVLAIIVGCVNLVAQKGTSQHRLLGWCWLIAMAFVTISSFWIRSNDGQLSWIHGLTVWTIISMVIAIISIKRGNVKQHASFMIGTMVGALIAGVFALAPGRLLSAIMGYG